MEKIRVLVVDDHALVRQGIVTFLQAYGDLEVVGEAVNGREALTRAGELRPAVVLMDMVMPDMDGIAATHALKALLPDVKVLILTSFGEVEHVQAALRAGADGYLLKDLSADDLAGAIRATRRGEMPLAPQVTSALVTGTRIPHDVESARLAKLSERERAVLVLLGRGLSNREMATQLSISEKTVKFHMSSILTKLDVHDRTQAALFAARHGLTPPE